MKRLDLAVFFILATSLLAAQNHIFFISTSDATGQPSMAICELDEAQGEMTLAKSISTVVCPNYMALSNDRQNLYTVGHERFSNSSSDNCVHSFNIPQGVLDMGKLNTQSSFGVYPCHISLSPNGKFLFVANYVSGSVASYGIMEDGSVGEKLSVWKYEGKDDPKGHYIHTSNDGRFVYAVFLGLDRVMNFSLSEEGEMSLNPAQEYLSVPAKSGPRHMAFHENGNFAFILNELGNTVISCSIDSASGALSIIDIYNTLPDGYTGTSYGGAIRIQPNGEYLYCSNRGHNSIVSFKIEDDGSLTKAETNTVGIDWVRDFNITPSGKYLIAGFEKNNEFALCQLDETGGISVRSSSLSFIKPACFVFYGEAELSTFVHGKELVNGQEGTGVSIFHQGQQLKLNYSFQPEKLLTMEVFNLMGQKIFAQTEPCKIGEEHSLDLSSGKLTSGIYYCRLRSHEDSETLAFYIQ